MPNNGRLLREARRTVSCPSHPSADSSADNGTFHLATVTVRRMIFRPATHVTFLTTWILPWLTALVLAIISTESWGRSALPVPSGEAYRTYCGLVARRDVGREEWLRVVNAMVCAARAEPQTGRHLGLLYGGRACLELFRREKRPEDLAIGIRLLNEFKSVTRADVDWLTALKELKKAHLLQRQMGSRVRPDLRSLPGKVMPTTGCRVDSVHDRNPETSAGGAAPAQVTLGADREKRIGASQPSTPISGSPVLESETRRDCGPSGVWPERKGLNPTRPTAAIQGNPFYLGHADRFPPSSFPEYEAALQPQEIAVDVSSKPEPPLAAPIPSPPPRAKDPKLNRRFLVVVDPGHGGKDPGAVSSNGKLKEKDVTLALAKRIKTLLEGPRGGGAITVSLTRSDDRFLTVAERTAFANDAEADLFISIHCNAYPDPSASGVETYFLSKAKSKRAMMVAARENGIPLATMTDLEATLLDLMVTSKKSESERLAQTVHESLTGHIRLPRSRMDRGVKQAPFYVLLGVTMPAVLVECAYLSNSRETAKLADPRYLDLVAEGIAAGAESYVKGLREAPAERIDP